MPHSADAIANFFLKRAGEEKIPITPMKLQKLIFLAHAWHLALDKEGRPLINEPVEAWKYGPVIRSIYREFRRFGDQGIDCFAQEFDPKTFSLYPPTIDQEDAPDVDRDFVLALLERVWEVYKGYTPIELANMTHLPEEPWKVIYDTFHGNIPPGVHIPNELIRQCYQRKLEPVAVPRASPTRLSGRGVRSYGTVVRAVRQLRPNSTFQPRGQTLLSRRRCGGLPESQGLRGEVLTELRLNAHIALPKGRRD